MRSRYNMVGNVRRTLTSSATVASRIFVRASSAAMSSALTGSPCVFLPVLALESTELNVKVLGHEVDVLWRSARVVAEVDGYAFHSSARSFAADRRRDAELTAAGYRVLRFTWADVTDGKLATVVRLAQAIVR